MRVGTLAGLTVLDARTALKHDRLTLRNDICKRKHGYTVPVNKQARCALLKLLSLRKQMDCAEQPDGLLVMSRKHNGMSVRSYQARMQFWRGVAELGVDASPHWFRHTVGHRIMTRTTARNPLRRVQSALGHADINSSAIYTRPTREDMAETFREIA
jgi:site-specific recombinase XerC